jgi:hypothetical protein
MLFGQFMSDSSTYSGGAFNISAGGEFTMTVRNKIDLSLFPSLGYLYSGELYTSIHIIRLELGARLAFGGVNTHVYVMPLAFIHLGTKTVIDDPYKDYGGVDNYLEPQVNGSTFGLELGVRYMGWEGANADFFIRIETTPFTFKDADDDYVLAMMGLRIAF